jgi:hypothetical protein
MAAGTSTGGRSPDGKSFGHTIAVQLDDLYLLEGLRHFTAVISSALHEPLAPHHSRS